MKDSSEPPAWAWRLTGAFMMLMGIMGLSLSVARLITKGDMQAVFYVVSCSVTITCGTTLLLIGDPWSMT